MSTVPVASRQDVQRVVTQMRADLAGRGSQEWENPTLDRFLDALEAVLDSLPTGLPGTATLKRRSPIGRSSRTSWSPPPDTSKQLPPLSNLQLAGTALTEPGSLNATGAEQPNPHGVDGKCKEAARRA